MNTTDDRLARLEEESFFQDRMLRELGETAIRQQKQLDALEKEMKEAMTILRALRDRLAQQPENSVPPHYPPSSF